MSASRDGLVWNEATIRRGLTAPSVFGRTRARRPAWTPISRVTSASHLVWTRIPRTGSAIRWMGGALTFVDKQNDLFLFLCQRPGDLAVRKNSAHKLFPVYLYSTSSCDFGWWNNAIFSVNLFGSPCPARTQEFSINLFSSDRATSGAKDRSDGCAGERGGAAISHLPEPASVYEKRGILWL